MSNYTKSTNFATKDNLPTGDPLKIVKGTEIDTEFNNIATAIATKTDNSAAAITGGTITGITDLAIADGGTGASTATAALNNLLPSQASAANKYLQSDGTNASWDAISINTSDITGTLAVANGGTGVTSSTGTGSVVLSNSPTLVTPTLGAASASTLDVSGNVTLSGGTASTVPYLNGSKVVTSSGALQFDGSNLGVGTSASYRVDLGSATSDDAAVGIRIGRGGSSTTWSLIDNVGGSGNYRQYSSGTPTLRWLTSTNGTSWSEQMRLNATGLGVGNNNPTEKLDVTGSALVSGSVTASQFYGSFNGAIGNTTAYSGAFTTLNASSTVTFSGGTANGIGYLNGSKVFTTGSVLKFDGVNLASDRSAGTVYSGTNQATWANGIVLNNSSTPATGLFNSIYFSNSANVINVFGVAQNASGYGDFVWAGNSGSYTEWMKLSSTGLTLTSNPTLSGGTANGVTYLNGSKVLTSGSALTFDGTNATIGLASGSVSGWGAATLMVKQSLADVQKGLVSFASANTNAVYIGHNGTVGELGTGYATTGGVTPLTFSLNSTEYMRLTSTGLGIGTSSPSYKLDVQGSAANIARFTSSGASTSFQLNNTNANAWGSNLAILTGGTAAGYFGTIGSLLGTTAQDLAVYATSGNGFRVYTNGSNLRATFDSSGNLGLGVTPSAWNSGTAIQNKANSSWFSDGSSGYFATNAYYSTGFKYTATGAAAQYIISSNGQHQWFNAPSGTAGNAISFTQAMTLDANGALLVGKTSASGTTFGGEIRADGSVWSGMSASTNATSTLNVYSTGAAAYRFYVGMGGTINATSTTITAISDQRLKENIRDLDEGLATVMALKPRKFDWKTGKGQDIKNARGFIAQEFETVLPDMIEEWRDPAPEGEEAYKAINANLIPTLVKAIQELKTEFDAYKASHP